MITVSISRIFQILSNDKDFYNNITIELNQDGPYGVYFVLILYQPISNHCHYAEDRSITYQPWNT